MEPLNEDIDLSMLVDDNETDNYVAEQVIKKAKFSRRVKVYSSSLDALAYLSNHQHKAKDIPEIIFLDINMPGADAFTFINEFEKLSQLVKDKSKLIILSNIEDPNLLGKIAKNKYVINLIQKPMGKSILANLKKGVNYSNITFMKLN